MSNRGVTAPGRRFKTGVPDATARLERRGYLQINGGNTKADASGHYRNRLLAWINNSRTGLKRWIAHPDASPSALEFVCYTGSKSRPVRRSV